MRPARCDIVSVAGDRKGVDLHLLKKYGHGVMSGPLGCAHDDALDAWLVADYGNYRVRVVDGEIMEEAFSVILDDRPGAVAVADVGRLYGLLDDRRVFAFDPRSEAIKEVSPPFDKKGACRGMSASRCGRILMTMHVSEKRPEMLCYDVRRCAEPVATVAYNIASFANVPTLKPLPCFIDCKEDVIVISDLGSGHVFTTRCDPTTADPQFTDMHELKPGCGSFLYPSGVYIGASGETVVCDARARKLHWFTGSGTWIGMLRPIGEFCYGSGICVSRDGRLIVCARRDGEVLIYKLQASENGVATLGTKLNSVRL